MPAILTQTEITDRGAWNSTLRQLPWAHILQSWDWGEFKRAAGGWQPQRLAFKRGAQVVAMASVALRRMGPLKVMYVSKGPALDYSDMGLFDDVITELENRARQQGVVWLKIDPDVIQATGLPDSEDDRPDTIGTAITARLKERKWRFSDSQVQFRNTIHIDLTRSNTDILMAMSGSTRRKIRVASKKEVHVRAATLADLPVLYQLYQVTGQRDGFLIRPFDYYRRAWQEFMRVGLAHALIAEYQGRPIAQLLLFHFGQRCWYFYGASSNEERQRMPNYALQWEAIQWAKSQGYGLYDMWGAPDVFDESDSLWGVYQFKRGFRGQVIRHIGAWDYVPRPLLYRACTEMLPRLLHLIR